MSVKFLHTKPLFVALQLADIGSTLACFYVKIPEWNPLNGWFINHFGMIGGLLLAKIIACGIVYSRTWRLLWAINSFYMVVILWNLFIFSTFYIADVVFKGW